MRVWFLDVFAHCPKDLGSKKLGEQGHLVKFIGYPHNSSGYRTYDPTSHKVDVVWAPVFQEQAHPHHLAIFCSQADDFEEDEVEGVNRDALNDDMATPGMPPQIDPSHVPAAAPVPPPDLTPVTPPLHPTPPQLPLPPSNHTTQE